MKKISFKNIFKKTERDQGSRSRRWLWLFLILVILLGAIAYLGYPMFFPPKASTPKVATFSTKTNTTTSTAVSSPLQKEEPVVQEKTPFDIEMEKRKQAYEEKIFAYEPYEPPSYRNPFQKVSVFSSKKEEEAPTEEEEAWWKQTAIYKPELPPDTKLNGIVGNESNRVAMIEIDGDTFIAKLYDILLDKYIVKEIRKNEVILEIEDYEFSLKIGGEEASNE